MWIRKPGNDLTLAPRLKTLATMQSCVQKAEVPDLLYFSVAECVANDSTTLAEIGRGVFAVTMSRIYPFSST